MERRDFLKTSAAGLVLGSTPFFNLSCSMGPHKLSKIGVQTYSVRDLMSEDFEGTLEQIAEIGYDQLEFAGYYGKTPQEVRSIIDELGLTSPANHAGGLNSEEGLATAIEAGQIIGHEYLIMASLPRPASYTPPPRPPEGQPYERQAPVYTVDDVKQITDMFNQIGETCKEAGMKFAYHNHTSEFVEVEGGGMMYDMMLEQTEPDFVAFEMDLGWAVEAGADPLAYFEKYPGRFELFHVKEPDGAVPVGQGGLDFASIFAQSKQAGVKHYIVEFEGREEQIAGITAGLQYLRNLTF
ncbi:sugar phosphate isomerase/epimerase [bacterium]|nr:sugar phosphate isomerase/epimerase [bacterium]